MSAERRAQWVRLFTAQGIRELVSLGREYDIARLAEAMLNLAQRLEATEHLETAAALYAAVAETYPGGHEGPRAQRRLDALVGRGAALPRAEFLFRRVASQASDGSGLAAMILAGGVFQRARLALGCRLAQSPAGLLSRGVGARLVSGLGGLLLEAPTFTLSHRLFQTIATEHGGTPDSSWVRETWGAWLTLGGLRAMGGLGGAAVRAWGSGPGLGLLRFTVPTLAMFSGILLGRRLEEWAGLRPADHAATLLPDAFATLLQFRIAGRLVHEAAPAETGRGLALEARMNLLATPGTDRASPRLSLSDGLEFALASPEPGVPAVRRSEPRRVLDELPWTWLASMSNDGNGNGPPRRPSRIVPPNENANVIPYETFLRRRRAKSADATPPLGTDLTRHAPVNPLFPQLDRAADSDHWLEQLRLGMMTWHPKLTVRQFAHEFHTVETRLAGQPDYVVQFLGYFAVRNRALAKAWLLRLDLITERSPLRSETGFLDALRRPASHSLSPEALHDLNDLLYSRFRVALRDFRPLVAQGLGPETQDQWRQRLDGLSRVYLESLRDPTLTDAQFLFMTDRLGLHDYGFPMGG